MKLCGRLGKWIIDLEDAKRRPKHAEFNQSSDQNREKENISGHLEMTELSALQGKKRRGECGKRMADFSSAKNTHILKEFPPFSHKYSYISLLIGVWPLLASHFPLWLSSLFAPSFPESVRLEPRIGRNWESANFKLVQNRQTKFIEWLFRPILDSNRALSGNEADKYTVIVPLEHRRSSLGDQNI